MADSRTVHLTGTRAAQPAASMNYRGIIYCVEDEGFILERCNDAGLAWDQYSPPPGDVVGPGTVVDKQLVRFNGTTGLSIEPSPVSPIVQDDGRISSVTDPSSAQDAATKSYVDLIAINIGKRARVRAATTAAITIATGLNNGDTIDGVVLATGDIVLVKDQAAPAENGVYVVAVSPARSSEYDAYDEHPGSLVLVQEGTINADTAWLCTSNVGGTIGVTAIVFGSLAVASALADNSVTDAKLRDSAALSVIGNATNGVLDPADIVAGTDHQLLRRSGSALGFGALNLAQAAAVTGVLPTANLSAPGRLIGIQIITATGAGVYTPTAGTTSIVMELLGAGGGGSGTPTCSASQWIMGNSGGGGGWLQKRLIADFSGAAYSVGAKGTGGPAGNNAGTAGGNTTFTTTAPSSTVYTAPGGALGGVPRSTLAAPIDSIADGAGGNPSTGDLNIKGGTGGPAVAYGVNIGISGKGGTSQYSSGSAQIQSTTSNGGTATGKGGGGGGGNVRNNGGTTAGADGTDGMIIIYEYA